MAAWIAVAAGAWSVRGEGPPTPTTTTPTALRLARVATTPHDTDAFTQGLVFDRGFLYESTGIYGRSSLRKVEIATGNVVQRLDLPRGFFAEGIALIGDEIWMLSWESELCLVFDRETFREVKRFWYRGEGWGLTFDGTSLWMSNGSATLQRRDPQTFEVLGTLAVTLNTAPLRGPPLRGLNELEWVEGEIWANVFGQLKIARIDPTSGRVIGWIDLTTFLPRDIPLADATSQLQRVLNGMAFDPETQRLFVTGKLWPVLHTFKLSRHE